MSTVLQSIVVIYELPNHDDAGEGTDGQFYLWTISILTPTKAFFNLKKS